MSNALMCEFGKEALPSDKESHVVKSSLVSSKYKEVKEPIVMFDSSGKNGRFTITTCVGVYIMGWYDILIHLHKDKEINFFNVYDVEITKEKVVVKFLGETEDYEFLIPKIGGLF